MNWWKKALMLTVVWMALTIGGGMLVTDVLLKPRITPQQDEAISEVAVQACGFGIALIWLVTLVRRKQGLQ